MFNICNCSPIKAKNWENEILRAVLAENWWTGVLVQESQRPPNIRNEKNGTPGHTMVRGKIHCLQRIGSETDSRHLAALRSGEGVFYTLNGKTSLILLGEKSFKIKGKHISGKHKVIFYLNSYTIKTLQIIWENKGRKGRARDLGGGTSTVEVLRSRQQQLQRPQLATRLAQL